MDLVDFILDTFDNIQSGLMDALEGLSHEELTWQPGPEANPIGFVLWHQLRCEDAMVNSWLRHESQLWISEQWCHKLNLPADPGDDGYGYTAEQVAAFPVPPLTDLLGYGEAVRTHTREYLGSKKGSGLDDMVETPAFGEMGVGQIFSVLLCEIAFHTGQIAYLRGLQRGINA